ncbi:TetR/AcrR family transcriptional regulator [Streptomyces sp. RPT161]|uniref:TetR/AcrR family transcriptional regulator n=1 Tax=Streptomyces sp. RPT161 TaxID=3015993 RepID=UPI0022B8AA39|nr:TetR/AcrR family transcriptional regulator [Streptomyces sp. RPT161]
MGNREDLLAGAKRCLWEKGYARTTVRDITAAAGGVSMAAIGYHFGSREALLNAALIEGMDEWGAEVRGALAESVDPAATPVERYTATWTAMVDSLAERRQLWLASIEALLQAEHAPEVRAGLAHGQQEGRRGMAAWIRGVDESAINETDARTLGSVQMALLSGVMMQWLTDPAHAPTGHEVVAGLRELADRLESQLGPEGGEWQAPPE